ncbi:MAG: glutathione S-transferase family protein [Qingshengfaniella sp.]
MTQRKLYQFGDSPCCMKVRMVLEAKGLPWEEVFIESWKFDHFQPDYLEMNPYGIVPTLVDGDRILSQSNVIAEYLEDAYPDPPLRPGDPWLTAVMRKWMYIEQDHLFGHIVTLSFNSMMKLRVEGFGLAQLQDWSRRHPDQVKAQDYLKRVTAPADPARDAAARKDLRWHLEMLEAELALYPGPWICGEMLTLAEVALAGIFDRLVYLREETLYADLPLVVTWFDRLRETAIYRKGEHRFSARMWGPLKPVAAYRDQVR